MMLYNVARREVLNMGKAGVFELALANKVGKVLEILANKYNYDPEALFAAFVSSDVFEHIMDWDVAVVSQSRYYIAQLCAEEFGDNVRESEAHTEYTDDLFWLGYLLTRWCQIENIKGRDIANEYDLDAIYWEYETLHTLSIESAIDHIKEDDRR